MLALYNYEDTFISSQESFGLFRGIYGFTVGLYFISSFLVIFFRRSLMFLLIQSNVVSIFEPDDLKTLALTDFQSLDYRSGNKTEQILRVQ